jgi:NAD(P)-dependent dehydrogenase (short-subunit alcohol dehydrogenase family)
VALVVSGWYGPPIRGGWRIRGIHLSKSPEKAVDLVNEIEEQDGNILAIATDSASPSDLQHAIASVKERFGLLYVFISNAGILKVGSVSDVSIEDFDQMFDVNVREAFSESMRLRKR